MHYFLNRAYRAALFAFLGVVFCGGAQAQTAVLKNSPVLYFFGATPVGGLAADSTGRLFGAIGSGSYAPGGLLYRVEANLTSIPTIYQYGRLDVWQGANPGAGLMLGSDGNLYGVTRANSFSALRGGAVGFGTVFRVSPDGANYTSLVEFEALAYEDVHDYLINATGSFPSAALIEGMDGGVRYLYGTTFQGGTNGTGTIFKIRADGAGGLVILHHFAEAVLTTTQATIGGVPQFLRNGLPRMAFDVSPENGLKNADGANPDRQLLLGSFIPPGGVSTPRLYGTTNTGGANGTGVFFSLNLDGSNFESVSFDVSPPTILAVIQPAPPAAPLPELPDFGKRKTNKTGAYPASGLVQAANGFIYGTASSHGGFAGDGGGYGNGFGYGTIFRVDPNAALRIQSFFAFTGHEGAFPGDRPGELILGSDGLLVGVTQGNTTEPTVTTGVAGGNVFKVAPDGLSPPTQECIFSKVDTAPAYKGAFPTHIVQTAPDTYYGIAQAGYNGSGAIFKCAATEFAGPVAGVPPSYDDGGGAMQWWLLAALAILLGLQTWRVRRA